MADNFLTEEERARLDKGIEQLSRMADSLFVNDRVPDIKEMRIAKEIIEATSTQITRVGELRLRQENNEANEGLVEKTAELIKELAKQKSTRVPSLLEERTRDIPERDLETLELVDGEMDIGPQQLNKEDFIEEENV
jgi:hypothetical protein